MTVQWKSREEYFALIESDPEHRYEYLDGYISMMTERTERPAPQFLAQSAMARFARKVTLISAGAKAVKLEPSGAETAIPRKAKSGPSMVP